MLHRLVLFSRRMALSCSCVIFLTLFVTSTPAQVISNWTQKSIAGDSSTAGESSAAVAMDASFMFVVDNEHQKLRLFQRFPATCVDPVYTLDVTSALNLPTSNDEVDFEAMAMKSINGTNVIYWLGSHSNAKNGNIHPNRYRLLATRVNNVANTNAPYSLTTIGHYDFLRTDICNWDRTNAHGLGSNYFALTTSTNSGTSSEDVDGFNMEGLCFGPDGNTAYIGFRTPRVNGSGPTTASGQRTNALVIPLLNMSEIVSNNVAGKAKLGAPFTLNLGSRGIRSMDTSYPGNFLITAGPAGDVGSAPNNFRLYTWTGVSSNTPIERLTTFPSDYTPEGAILPAAPIVSNTVVQFVSDDATACWRSFTALAGVANQPALQMLQPSNNVARFNLLLTPTQAVTIEWSTNFSNWTTLRKVTNTAASTVVTDAPASNPLRFYRARF